MSRADQVALLQLAGSWMVLSGLLVVAWSRLRESQRRHRQYLRDIQALEAYRQRLRDALQGSGDDAR